MSVYKPQGSPYFHFDFVWHGRRFYGSTGCRGRREALAYEARQRHDAVLPSRPDREPITLDDACGLYMEHAAELPSWATARYMMVALVNGLGGNRLLGEISQRELQSYVAKRRHGRSNASANRELDAMRAIWRKAQKARFDVGEMPDWLALRLRVPNRAPRELGADEEARLFAALRPDVADACDFALKSGWRRAEVIGLRWSDCDFQTRQAATLIKGGDVVKRPLTTTLLALIANQPKVGPFVFTYVCRKTRDNRRAGERYPMTPTGDGVMNYGPGNVVNNNSCSAPDCPQCRPFDSRRVVHSFAPSVQETLGTDPISKLADAINNLADALRATQPKEGL